MPLQAVLALDSNGTLVHQHHLFSRKDQLPGIPVYERDGMSFQVVPRPSARAFLEHFQALRIPMFVLTGGGARIQRLVMSIAGFDEFVPNVYDGGRDMPSLAKLRWALVDDQLSSSGALHDKLAQLAGKRGSRLAAAELDTLVQDHFVRCQPFENHGDPKPLTELIPEVSRKLGLTA